MNDHPPVTVLVVEDDDAIRRALATALTRGGFAPVVAARGGEAHRICAQQHVDVLVADYRLPDMRADELYHLATSIHPHLARATIFITGDISEEAEARIANTGGELVRKPFDLKTLLDRVRALAPKRHSASA